MQAAQAKQAENVQVQQGAAIRSRMELYMALWWVPAGHIPTVAEGMARIETLRRLGSTAEAFTFRTPFPAPGADEAPPPVLDECA